MSAPTPNIFTYATSELSQDAFLCWILEWADEDYRDTGNPLHSAGIHLVQDLLKTAGHESPADPFSIDILPQVNGEVDIVALVGEDSAIIIEDKVDTSNHSNQLDRYKKAMNDRYEGRDLAFVYLKTEDQSSYSKVREKGWSTFTREDLLNVLRGVEPDVENAIFEDFLGHLEAIEDRMRRFETVPVEEWEPRDDAFKGLYMTLQEELGEGKWKYVPNAQGGFLSFFWGWKDIEEGQLFLHLEEDTLEVKIKVLDSEKQSRLRNEWSKRLIEGIDSDEFSRPDRFGKGDHMTIAEYGDYRARTKEGLLNFEDTVATLEAAQVALEDLVHSEG